MTFQKKTRQDNNVVHFKKLNRQKRPGKLTVKSNTGGLIIVEIYYKALTVTAVLSGSWINRPSYRIECPKTDQDT